MYKYYERARGHIYSPKSSIPQSHTVGGTCHDGLGRRVEMKIRRWLYRAEQQRHMGKHRIRVMKKPDESRVDRIVRKARCFIFCEAC